MAFEYKRKSTREELEYKGGNIPDGVYELMVDKAEYKENQSTRGAWVAAVTLKVVSPEAYKGRLVFENMNVEHPTPKVEEGGQRQFERLLDAAGIEGDSPDIKELETCYVIARIGEERQNPNKEPDPNFKPRNRVARYYFADEPKPEIGIDPPKAKPVSNSQSGRGRPADNRDRGESRGRPADNRSRSDERGSERNDGRGERSRDNGNDRGAERGDERGGRNESRGESSRGSERNRDFREDVNDDIPFEDGREKGGEEYKPRDRNEGGSRSPFGAGRR